MPEKSIEELPRDLRALNAKGNDALQRENFDYAIALYCQILEKHPGILDIRKALRSAQAGKSGASKSLFKRAFSNVSSSPLIGKAQLALRRNPLEAIHIAEQVLNTDANNAMAHKLLADAALAADLPRTAVLSLELLVKSAPKDKELNIKLAEAWSLSGQKSNAERVLEDLRREYPADNEIFMALKNISARKTLDEGGYEALAGGGGSYRDILKNKEEAVSIEQEKRQVKAGDVADRLIQEKLDRLKTDPNNLKTLRDLGDLYLQKADYDQALVFYQRIMSVDGGSDASLQKQVADIQIRKFNAALAKLDQSAADYEEQAAKIKAERQAFQLEECRQRSEKYPTDLVIRFELGQLYFENGKISEAIQEFQKARSNPNKRLQAMTYLAKCFEKRGMNDLAARTLQDALKEKVGFDEEKKELVYTLGCVFEKMGKKEDAIEQFKIIYEMDIGYKDVAKKVDDYYSGGG